MYLRRNPQINWQKIMDKTVLIYRDKFNSYFEELNQTSSLIWDMLDGTKTKEAIFSEIKKIFTNLPLNYREAVNKFIVFLLKKKFAFYSKKREKDYIAYENFNKKIKFRDPKTKIIKKMKSSLYFGDELLYLIHKYKKTNRYNLSSQTYFPIRAYIDVTKRCNLNCNICFKAPNEFKEKDFPIENIKKIIDKISEANIPMINLLGGEPFLRKDIIDIIDYAIKKGIEIRINTNAYNFDDILIKKLKKYRNMLAIVISIDSPDQKIHDEIRVKGSYVRAIQTTETLVKNGFFVQISSIGNKKNFWRIPKFYKVARELKVKTLIIIPFLKQGYGKSHIEEYNLNFFGRVYLEVLSHFYKFMASLLNYKTKLFIDQGYCIQFLAIHFDPNGSVHFCSPFPRTMPLGNVMNDKLLAIWHSKKYKSLFNWDLIKEPCKSCIFKNYCLKGCRAEMYALTNDFFSGDINCYRGKFLKSICNIFVRK